MLRDKRLQLIRLRNEINRQIHEVEQEIVRETCPFTAGDVVEHSAYGIYKVSRIAFNDAYFGHEAEYRLVGRRLIVESGQWHRHEEYLPASANWEHIGDAGFEEGAVAFEPDRNQG